MQLHSFSEIETFLSNFTPSKPGKYKLDRMNQLMGLLDSPQEKLSIIHIAGTSGKTSTAYYVASFLSKAGAKVGLTVSPHVFEISERVQVNGSSLSEKEFSLLFNKFINIDGVLGLAPTYFEIMVAFAYWCFVELSCSHAVVEVGLGGLLDGTNVIENPNKVAVVTDIGLDHTTVLGESLREIAIQKAGIIKHHNHVFSYFQNKEVQDEILEACTQNNAVLHGIEQEELSTRHEISLDLPLYQRRNWLLACEVADFVINRDDNLCTLSSSDLASSQKVRIPARMETVQIAGQPVIIDGAHNPQKLRALCKSIKNSYPNKSVAVLTAFAGSKVSTVRESLDVLHSITDDIVVTEFSVREDYAHTSMKSSEVLDIARDIGFESAISQPSIWLALKEFRNIRRDIKLVTGSFYLIASLKDYIEREQ